jgi:hypothetical protein
MNAIPAGYVETKKGVYVRRDLIKKGAVGRKTILSAKSESCDSKPQPPIQHGTLGPTKREKAYTGRILVRIKISRKRCVDPCNAGQKYLVDCLRYAGILVDDREEDIALEIHQEKTRGEEETLIELFHDAGSI